MIRTRMTILLSLWVSGSPLLAQTLEQTVRSLPAPVHSGYAASIAGETISYHSANAFVKDALLVRATDGLQPIEWVTAPVPEQIPRAGVSFAWLAGLSGSKGIRRFDMNINGHRTLQFSTAGDSAQKRWTVHTGEGATLTFIATEADRFGDLFGYMFLSLPRTLLKAGAPLTIRVTGEAAGSQAWYMTFQHALADTARVQAYSALLQTRSGAMQPLVVEIESYKGGRSGEILVDGRAPERRLLRWGANVFTIEIAPVSAPALRNVRVRLGGQDLLSAAIAMHPVRQRSLYLIPHAHTDIGYSDYQAVVEQEHMHYVDQAIQLAERTSAYPEGARFKWNIEVLWPLESYIRAATPEKLKVLSRAISAGWISPNALYSNVLTGLCSAEETFHLTDYARHLHALFGCNVRTAMISDIPSYSATIITALARAGVRYLSSGPNYVPMLPDGGDRIGWALKAWGDRPFYWVSPSAQDTVLFWMAGRGYSWFHGLNMGELEGANPSAIFDYIDELDRKDYPYEMVQVRYTIGDNGPPDERLPEAVRRWNEMYISPRLVISSAQEMFERFERLYGRVLPVRSGDFNGYWEDGAVSTAREVAEKSAVAEGLTQTETLFAMLHPEAFPAESFIAAWRNVHLFDEHTWGAANSISDPDSPSVKAQWQYKRAFLLDAQRQAAALRSALIRPFSGGPISALDVVNTDSWVRSDLVVLPETVITAGVRARDSRGMPVEAQRLAGGELALLVRDVPPMGSVRVSFESGEAYAPSEPVSASDNVLQSGSLRIVLDRRTGAIRSLQDGGVEYADSAEYSGLNAYLYTPGYDPRRAVSDTSVRIRIEDGGPLVVTASIESTPPGCVRLLREVRLISSLHRVDIIDRLDKRPVREKESVHIAFPLRLAEPKLRFDNGWGIVRAGTDELRGACEDFYSAHLWADLSDAARGVTLALPDAPLIEKGQMTDETLNRAGVRDWKESADTGKTLFSYLMNNYWHTNYKADQGGEAAFRFSLWPHLAYSAAESERFAVERAQPLIAMPHLPEAAVRGSLFSVSGASTIATGFKPTADLTGWILHLYNPSESSDTVQISWHGGGSIRIYGTDLSEARGAEASSPLLLPRYGVLILRLERVSKGLHPQM
ncbi:MAG TPA: hypothetical protein VL126_14745 [Bacteroidota bacterium]|nr:hypothetical protein [Bacteroidota bacterium]